MNCVWKFYSPIFRTQRFRLKSSLFFFHVDRMIYFANSATHRKFSGIIAQTIMFYRVRVEYKKVYRDPSHPEILKNQKQKGKQKIMKFSTYPYYEIKNACNQCLWLKELIDILIAPYAEY